MKKRVKLLTTIASLCLAVALMAFGVYAATQATMQVTSQVSFTAQVDVTWTWSVVGGNVAGEAVNVSGSKEMNAQTKDDENTIVLNELDENAIPEAITFDNEDNDVITYTFGVTNNSTGEVTLDVTHTAIEDVKNADETVTYLDVTYKVGAAAGTAAEGAWATEYTLAAGETKVFVLELKMTDPAVGVAETEVSATFNAHN